MAARRRHGKAGVSAPVIVPNRILTRRRSPGALQHAPRLAAKLRDCLRVMQRRPGVHLSFALDAMGPGSAAQRSIVFAARSSFAVHAALRPGQERVRFGKTAPKAISDRPPPQGGREHICARRASIESQCACLATVKFQCARRTALNRRAALNPSSGLVLHSPPHPGGAH
jgi:hypothetical protein